MGICSIYPTGKFLEIGSFRGRTALNIIYNFPNMNIFTFDLPNSSEEEANLKYELIESDKIQAFQKNKDELRINHNNYFQKITSLKGDSAKYDFTKYSNFFDIILIDGSHKYENVVLDLRKFNQNDKNKGYII